jgi:uncharacterized protein (TIGR02145 family)
VTATPTSTGVAPAKRKSSGIITATGKSSPISVPGLTFGVNYVFSVVAMNAVGGSSVTSTITAVTPCTLNTATPQQTTPIYLNTFIEEPITISTTGRATGIGAASGLPEGVDASWSANVISIRGTPTESGTFEYTIPLTGGCGSVNATGTITVILPFICGTSTISDYDGNVYNTVSIGQQCWTKQNLKVTKYNDGSNIPEIPGNGTWNNTIVTGARTVHGDLPSNLSTYGFLYNWYAATDEKKICPTGWYVPTLDQLQNMISFIGIEEAGKKLKKNDDLWIINTGTNISGFAALPGGYRDNDSSFGGIGTTAFFWSATSSNSNTAYRLYQYDETSEAYLNTEGTKAVGMSIRCLKD